MSFRIASYNILADAYVSPKYFPGSPPELLKAGARLPGLVRRIGGLCADAVGLQEVEPAALAELERSLAPRGWRAHFAAKGRGRPDGCALLVREPGLATIVERRFEYPDGREGGDPSGHVALLAVLEHDGRRFGLAVTHVKWDPPDPPPERRFGARQIPLLLDELARVEPACATWVVCGDFNAEPESAVIDPLRRRGFRDAYGTRPRDFTCNANRRARRIDFLFHTPDLAAGPVPLPAIDDRTPLPSEAEPSDHLPIAASFAWD